MRKEFDRSTHPIGFVGRLRSWAGDDLLLSFSRYIYVRNQISDERRSFQVNAREVTARWLQRQLQTLGADQELAMESRVRLRGKLRHIPFLDFRAVNLDQIRNVVEALPGRRSERIELYASGRSFHAYFMNLLTPREWIGFMGAALLCNTPGRQDVVDTRWVGHRLIGGYGALRWSCNTSSYNSFPVRVSASAQ